MAVWVYLSVRTFMCLNQDRIPLSRTARYTLERDMEMLSVVRTLATTFVLVAHSLAGGKFFGWGVQSGYVTVIELVFNVEGHFI